MSTTDQVARVSSCNMALTAEARELIVAKLKASEEILRRKADLKDVNARLVKAGVINDFIHTMCW